MKAKKMVEVGHDELKEIIKRKHRKKTALFIWGPPGIGKSQVVHDSGCELAKEDNLGFSTREDVVNIESNKFTVIDKRLAQMDASDIKGLPNFTEGRKTTTWTQPEWFPTEGSGILFFDELNLAPPVVQAAAYSIILDRRLGNLTLPEGFSVIAAGNRAQDRAHTFELPKPLQNRFTHVELKPPSSERWVEWAYDNGIDERLISFILTFPQHLMNFNPDDNTKAFATPRTVEIASHDIKGLKFSNNEELIRQLVGSACGRQWASEFTAFIRLRDEINIGQIINNPKTEKLPEKADLLCALTTGIAERYDKDRNWKKILRVAITLCDRFDNAEYGMKMLRMMNLKDDDFVDKLVKIDGWKKLSKRYGKFLTEP
ncbi:MAG: hypothetical protein ACOC80_10530 [Petrotogales bacterium]